MIANNINNDPDANMAVAEFENTIRFDSIKEEKPSLNKGIF